jgi:hypothetical protein
MDKHYGWQEDRGTQGQGGPQNGQRWNERYRDDDQQRREARGGEYGGGWEQDNRRWTPSGADLDREDYTSEDEQYGGQSRGGFGSRGQARWSQGGGGQFRGQSPRGEGFSRQGYGNQGFSGGHYGGFANEGFSGQGNYGGNRGLSNQGYSGQRFSQAPGSQGGQTFRGHPSGGAYHGRGFAGRGPKGYQRSDERIKEQLSDRLMDDDDIDASEITVDVKGGEVTLTGMVSSREEKRAAEEIAEQSPGVREVQNHLRVGSTSAWGSRQDSTPGQSNLRSTERE